LVPETQTICYAWVFISNHAHFLLLSGLGGIAHLMRRLLICMPLSNRPEFSIHREISVDNTSRFGYQDGCGDRLIGVSISWATSESDTLFTVFDLPALKKQLLRFINLMPRKTRIDALPYPWKLKPDETGLY
jgi:hypothetical protein